MATESRTDLVPSRTPGAKAWAWLVGLRLERFAIAFGLLGYALWATRITWPLLNDPAHSMLGGFGDQSGGIALMREWVEAGQIPFLPGRIHDLSAPEGLVVGWGVNLSNWPYLLPAWLMALVVGPVAAFGVMAWLAPVLNGVVMQILATRVTQSRIAGLVAGFALAFVPFVVINAASHPQFGHAWPLVLVIWRIFEVAQRPTRRNAIWAGLAAIIAVGFTSYYVLIGGVLLVTCAVMALVYAWRTGTFARQLKIQIAIGVTTVAYVGLLAALALGGGASLRVHPESELYTYAARFHDYFVPFGASRLFGAATAPWLQAHEHGSNFTESTLYLGLVVMQLALIALVAAFARWIPVRLRWSALAALVIAAVGYYWSAPPKVSVAGLLLPTPSDAIQHVSSTWRVYSRFGILVIIGVVLIGAVGLAALTRGRHVLIGWLVGGLAIFGIGLDFFFVPGVTSVADSTAPPVYRILKDHPGGILAQYPLLPAGFGDSSDLYWQDAAGHPQFTGYAENGHDDTRALTLYTLTPKTVRGLASLGVRYIMVLDPPIESTPDPGRPTWGTRRIGSGAYAGRTATVYQVLAKPDPGYVYVQSGASPFDEGPANDPFSWITSPKAMISVDTPECRSPCSGTLRLRMSSWGIARQAALRDPAGKIVWQGTVPTRKGIDVQLPLSVAGGREELTLTASPGPLPIKRFMKKNADPRSVSVMVSRMRFVR